MLDYEKIKVISAQKGILDIVVEKDYILDWILWGISTNEYLREVLVFKGGTALHKMYFPDWRFSEDLDFTTISQVGNDELRDAIGRLCEKVRKQSGIDLPQREIIASGDKDSEWSFEVKIGYIGPRRQTRGGLPTILLHITNDELIKDKPIRKVVIAPYQDLPEDFAILTYSLEEILAEKIRTVFHQRCWPKDIYDTWRLLREVKSLIDGEKVLDVYYRKATYRGYNPEIPSDIDERILRIKKQWKEGLQRQINAPPDFDKVYPEVQGDKTFVEEKFKELLELQLMVVPKQAPKVGVVTEPDKKTSLVEFLKSKNPKSHGDKILVFGYFLEKFKGYFSFNLNDVETCYKEARLPKTKNFRSYITRLIRGGHLTDAEEKKDNKKAWRLLDGGLKYVEDLVPEGK